ncbi:DUF6301 family protein [Micropruina sonneratiae]|uniref:DUF6301 family protein n=1 Tax=Micropruina sonneratiae TaxID=2986940 RepID=UPI002225EF5E|nr:DUF6301 family protein [Micropruina sp. KQZ13P-5]MCW3156897.1 DUF6301 family protein [Micropruina sp. KQZ13P-5]
MTWRAMSAQRACDLVDFWRAVEWPRTPAQVQELGEQVGWTPDEDEMMENAADALSEPAVPIATMPTGETASFNFWVTDLVRGDLTAEASAFLNDQYTLLVREGSSRWGEPALADGEHASAQWELEGGARVLAGRGSRAVTVDFTTPQYARVLRELGE